MATMAKRLKRPRDSISLAKLIGDIATGQVNDAMADDGKSAAAVLTENLIRAGMSSEIG